MITRKNSIKSNYKINILACYLHNLVYIVAKSASPIYSTSITTFRYLNEFQSYFCNVG